MVGPSRVHQGQVSRARHELTGARLAPKNDETYRALQDRRPQEQVRAIPEVVLDINPSQPLQLEMRTSSTWWLFMRDAESVLR